MHVREKERERESEREINKEREIERDRKREIKKERVRERERESWIILIYKFLTCRNIPPESFLFILKNINF